MIYALKERLTDLPDHVEDPANRLGDMRFIDAGMKTGVITEAAVQHPAVTALGARFVNTC